MSDVFKIRLIGPWYLTCPRPFTAPRTALPRLIQRPLAAGLEITRGTPPLIIESDYKVTSLAKI